MKLNKIELMIKIYILVGLITFIGIGAFFTLFFMFNYLIFALFLSFALTSLSGMLLILFLMNTIKFKSKNDRNNT